MKLRALLLASALALVGTACVSGLQTQKQKIGSACAQVQAAGETIANAADAGFVSVADAGKAATLYHSTDKFCQPVASSLSPTDYATLLSAAAALVTSASKVQKP